MALAHLHAHYTKCLELSQHTRLLFLPPMVTTTIITLKPLYNPIPSHLTNTKIVIIFLLSCHTAPAPGGSVHTYITPTNAHLPNSYTETRPYSSTCSILSPIWDHGVHWTHEHLPAGPLKSESVLLASARSSLGYEQATCLSWHFPSQGCLFYCCWE